MKRIVRAIAAALLICAMPASRVSAQDACKLEPLGAGFVAAVRDGRTLLLDDGRELRLAGIEVAESSSSLLQDLAAGRALRLQGHAGERDRYGRLPVFAFIGDDTQSLQQTLLMAGQARVAARVGDKACAETLLRVEAAARAGRRGLWADPNFAPLSPENTSRFDTERGRFALVEGKVLSVRESGAIIYVNFGRRWTRDFTMTILRRLQGAFTAAGVEPKSLEGRRVRVRGWIERRGGPVIVTASPEQIELMD